MGWGELLTKKILLYTLPYHYTQIYSKSKSSYNYLCKTVIK